MIIQNVRPVSFSFFRKYATEYSTKVFPSTVDLNIVGRCNLNCTWCWGPEHDTAEPIRLEQWKNLVNNLQKLGTKNVIITGGEPLLKRWLPDLVQYIKSDLNMRVTLSTNGILIRRKAKELLPYVDDLGIPIDGPSHDINKVMRVGNFKHFDIAVDAIKYVQSEYPEIDLTVRTVVAKPNIEFVPDIGNILLSAGINLDTFRWKLYQVNPIGPRKGEILNGDWLVSLKDFNEAVDKSKQLNPSLNICGQPFARHAGRYFMVFPDGASHVIQNGEDGFPCEKNIGNVFENLDLVIENLNEDSYLEYNTVHGVKF
ncbi:MAG: radical SAM protein [Legionellaceae bacterium]|nr:radical SAM protein [Legionellaceae bacterium]